MLLKGLKFSKRIIAALTLVGLLAAISLAPANSLTGQVFSSTSLDTDNSPLTATTSDASTTSSNSLQNSLKSYFRFDSVKASRGYSLEFDGTDDYISIPENSVNSISSNFTVSGWLKVDEGGTYDSHTLIQKDSNYGLLFDGQPRIFLEVWDESANRHKFYSGNISDRINGWTHYAYTVDENDSVKLYIDGSLNKSWSIGFNVSDAGSNSVLIGKRNSNAYYTDGSMDDIRLYRRLLTSTEIKNMYRGIPVSTESLILHQKFNEGPKNCDVTSNNPCLTDDSKYSNSGVPHGFNDNNLATGSGWIQETPINRPTVKDYSTNSHLGTFYGGNNGQLKNFNLSHSDSGWTQGKIGEFALEFDGENDFVNISHVPKYNFTEFSVSIWAKDSADGWNDYLEKAGVFQLHHERGGYPSFRIFNSTGYSIDVEDGTPAVADGNWHHIVGTYNGEEACLYTDGSLVLCRNFDGPLANSTSPIELADDASNTNRYKGFLDDVRIYKKALSKSSVKSLYQGESVTKGLVGRWNFESGDRKTAYDTYYKSKGILSSSAIKTRPETYGVSDKVSFNESTVSAWYRKGELPEKVSSIGRRFATYCLLDTSDNQGTFSIASTHDGNFISIKELDSAGNVVDSWNKTVNKGQLWRFPCDDYGVDSAFKVTGTYPISMDYDSMIDARSSDDDWTSRAGEDIWFSIPNDNNELTITAYRNDTQVTLYNYSNGATKRSFTLDATEYWSCSDCTDNPAAFNVKTNGGHPVTVLYGKFDDNSGSSIMAPTRELYRVSKDYAENGQTIHIVAEEDNTNIEITDFAGGCTNTTITLNKGEVYSDSCGTGTINLKVNSTKPVSLTLIEANSDYGPSMFRSSTNTWGIGSEYYITASNDQGNSIGIISLAENNQIDISGSFSYSAELDKYENQYPVGNLPVNGYIHIDAEHPVAVIGDAGTNYESAMAILPLPKMNIAKAGKSGLGVTKDRVFGFNSGNIVSTRGLLHNNWQNIALTGGLNTSLYIGGEKQLTTDIASSSHTGSIEIGGVRGKIDELRIYNRSLSSSEVKELNLH